MATFGNRIDDLIGTDWSSLNSYSDIFNSAITQVADMVSPSLLLKYASDPLNLDGSTQEIGVEGEKIIMVTRNDGSFDRECLELNSSKFSQSQDPTSINLATSLTPVFALLTDGGTTTLKVFPLTTVSNTAKIYRFSYPTTDLTGASDITGIPQELEHPIILKACEILLQTYIKTAVQDEEDEELLKQLTTQIGTLQAQFQSEIARFSEGVAE